jgi:hypothetical protein
MARERFGFSAHYLTIGELFGDGDPHYVIPTHQRPYSWVERHWKDLWDDIATLHRNPASSTGLSFNKLDVSAADQDRTGRFEVSDGQQRIVTFFVLLCAIRDRLAELGADADVDGLNRLLYRVERTTDGVRHTARVVDQYPEVSAILDALAVGDPVDADDLFARLLIRAHTYFGHLIERQHSAVPDLRALTHTVCDRCLVIRNVVPADASVDVFIRGNDRGLPMEDLERLKADLIGACGSDDDRNAVADAWKRILVALRRAQARRSDEFLYHYALADVVDTKITTRKARSAILETGRGPVAIAADLADAAEAWSHIRQGRLPSGAAHPATCDLVTVPKLRAFRQLHPVLLAGRRLDEPDFGALADAAAATAFVTSVAEFAPQQWELELFICARVLRDGGDAALTDVLGRLRRVRDAHASSFARNLLDLDTSTWSRDNLRYLLGRLELHLQAAAGEPRRSVADGFPSDAYELEHLLPQSADAADFPHFASGQLSWWATRLGNLVVVEQPINASIQNSPWSRKAPRLADSSLLMPLALGATSAPVRGGDRRSRTLDRLPRWATLDPAAIRDRTRHLYELACECWEVLADTTTEPAPPPPDDVAPVAPTLPDEVTVPQVAPDAALAALEAIRLGADTVEGVTAQLVAVGLRATERQANYALNALRWAELVTTDDDQWVLTTDGVRVAALAPADRARAIAASLVRQSFFTAYRDAEHDGREAIVAAQGNVSGSTIGRRCSTLNSWVRWVDEHLADPSPPHA